MDKLKHNYFKKLTEKEAGRALKHFIKKYSYEIQYANEKTYRWIIEYSYNLCNAINKEHSGKSFLDFGCGIGAIDHFNNLFFDCNIDSCDWINRDKIYDIMSLKKPKYLCSDWSKTDFKIYNCNKKYDAIIIMRSVLIQDNFNDFIKNLKKLLPYVKPSGDIVIFQTPKNFIKEIFFFLNKNNTNFFKSTISGNCEVYSLKPNTIETFVL